MKILTMNSTLAVTLAIALSGFFVTGAAHADDPGFYVGGSVGQASLNESVNSTISIDDEDTSFRLSAGYSFSDYFAVEGGYIDFGEVSDSFTVAGVTGRVEAEADGFDLALVGSLPVSEKFSLTGRAGYLFWDADVKATATGVPTISDSEDGNDLFFGIGAEYRFTDQWSLTGGWDRYELDDVDFDNLHVGVRYRF